MEFAKSALYFFSLLLSISAFANDFSEVEIQHAFKDENGRKVLIFKYKSQIFKEKENPKFMGTNLAFFCEEGACFQLQEKGSSSRSGTKDYTNYHKFNFENPHGESVGEFSANWDKGEHFIRCGNTKRPIFPLSTEERRQLTESVRKGDLPLKPLPNVRQREYLFKMKRSGEYVYVDAPKYNYSFDFRVFKGTPGNMRQLEVLQTPSRKRDGGTTEIVTGEGRIFSPSSLREEELGPPKFKGEELISVDQSFDVKSLGIPEVDKDSDLKTPCAPGGSVERGPRRFVPSEPTTAT